MEPPADFDSQIVPLLTKAGCNVAACHGAAAGRGGLRLSLWGLDPNADYRAIVREFEGRRVNPVEPEESLLLLKSTWQIDHGGEDALGRVPGAARRLADWIGRGAPRGAEPRLHALQITPGDATLVRPGDEVTLGAVAIFEDGSRRDVTHHAVFLPNDPSAAVLDDHAARVRIVRGGRHVVLVRFMNQVVPQVFVAPLTDLQPEYAADQQRNKIDDHILKTLKELGLPASPPADDLQFARRVYLDLTGRLPTPAQLMAFVEDPSGDKRDVLVDRLLHSEAFVDIWTYRFAKLLRIRSTAQDQIGAATFHGWLRDQIGDGVAYDELVRTLLTAEGDSHEVGPANFYRVAIGARNQAEYVSELLMGARMRCANCHNHPLDRWTQDDYHGLAAVFARIEQGRVVKMGSRGAVSHPRTGQPARPRIPGVRFVDDVADPRRLLADWITNRENPYFATAVVNRLWRFLMGRGLIEPTDDVRATNPPSHPQLLEFLSEDFIAHGYDLRHTLRLIATSATYARSSKPAGANASDTMYYSRGLERPLESEVLADALAQVTGVSSRYGDQPVGTRAVSLQDPQIAAPSLDILGRCSREQSCESLVQARTLKQSLHMINGALINDRLLDPRGRLSRMLQAGLDDEQIVRQFYMLALSRSPTSAESDYWRTQLAGAEPSSRRELLQDIVWSLLVCREFVTNH